MTVAAEPQPSSALPDKPVAAMENPYAAALAGFDLKTFGAQVSGAQEFSAADTGTMARVATANEPGRDTGATVQL